MVATARAIRSQCFIRLTSLLYFGVGRDGAPAPPIPGRVGDMLGVAEPPAPGGCDPIAGAGMGGGGGPAARPATNQMIPPITTTAATIRPITAPELKFCPMKGLLWGRYAPSRSVCVLSTSRLAQVCVPPAGQRTR